VSLIHIIVDHREANSGVYEALRAISDTEVALGCLDLGDYQLDERLLFERKTLRDLIASIKDARLFEQAGRLASHLYAEP
jgi:ERCC4-type nuclease